MRMKKVTVLAVLLGASGLPVYWVVAGEGHQQQTNYTIAEVELKLAEARFTLARKQLERSRKRPTTSMLTVVYEEAAESFERELAELKAGKKRDSFDRLLDEMGHLGLITARRIEQLESANAKGPGMVDEAEIALLRARHDILRLGAAHGELLRSADRQEKIDWQLEQLRSIQLLLADHLFEQGL